MILATTKIKQYTQLVHLDMPYTYEEVLNELNTCEFNEIHPYRYNSAITTKILSEIKQLISLFKSEHEHFLFVDYDFYKKWKYLIKFLINLNKNYKSCEIYRRKYKIYRNS